MTSTIPSGNRLDTTETRGAYTIRRDEIRVGAYRVYWVVNGPTCREKAFSTRRAARAYVDRFSGLTVTVRVTAAEAATVARVLAEARGAFADLSPDESATIDRVGETFRGAAALAHRE